MYQQFYDSKKEDFEANGALTSLKDYTSFKNALNDRQAVLGKTILVKDLDEVWIQRFHQFLKTKQPDKIKLSAGIVHTMKLVGNLNPKTPKKRFDTLKLIIIPSQFYFFNFTK